MDNILETLSPFPLLDLPCELVQHDFLSALPLVSRAALALTCRTFEPLNRGISSKFTSYEVCNFFRGSLITVDDNKHPGLYLLASCLLRDLDALFLFFLDTFDLKRKMDVNECAIIHQILLIKKNENILCEFNDREYRYHFGEETADTLWARGAAIRCKFNEEVLSEWTPGWYKDLDSLIHGAAFKNDIEFLESDLLRDLMKKCAGYQEGNLDWVACSCALAQGHIELLTKILDRNPNCLSEMAKSQGPARQVCPNEKSYLFLVSLASEGRIDLKKIDPIIYDSWLETTVFDGEALLLKYGFPRDSEIFLLKAVSKGALRLVKEAESEMLKISDREIALISACSSGKLEMLEYLFRLYFPIELPQACIPDALFGGGLPMVKFLFENGCKCTTLKRENFGLGSYHMNEMADLDPEAVFFVEEHFGSSVHPKDLLVSTLSFDNPKKFKSYLDYFRNELLKSPIYSDALAKTIQYNLSSASAQTFDLLASEPWFRLDEKATFKSALIKYRIHVLAYLLRKYPSEIREYCASMDFELALVLQMGRSSIEVASKGSALHWLMKQGLWLPRPKSFFYPFLFDKANVDSDLYEYRHLSVDHRKALFAFATNVAKGIKTYGESYRNPNKDIDRDLSIEDYPNWESFCTPFDSVGVVTPSANWTGPGSFTPKVLPATSTFSFASVSNVLLSAPSPPSFSFGSISVAPNSSPILFPGFTTSTNQAPSTLATSASTSSSFSFPSAALPQTGTPSFSFSSAQPVATTFQFPSPTASVSSTGPSFQFSSLTQSTSSALAPESFSFPAPPPSPSSFTFPSLQTGSSLSSPSNSPSTLF